MIIKKARHNNHYKKWIKWFLGILIVSSIIYFFTNPRSQDRLSNSNTIFCDLEEVSSEYFVYNGEKFNNAKTVSSDKSYSGKYSSKLDSKHKYGISYNIENVKPGERYIATIRRYILENGKFPFVISTKPSTKGYVKQLTPISTDEEGWELLQVEILIPHDQSIESISIFPYRSENKGIAFFDDLKIEVIKPKRSNAYNLDAIHLYLDNKAIKKINAKRATALKDGILQSSDNDWVKAKLMDNGSTKQDVKLRLKGDWTDHLNGDYWSYRVKMPSDKSWRRMQTFSLQDPKSRSYLDEWFYHKVLEKLDIITPRYGLIKLSQNDKKTVLYAYEEHFEKQVAEYKDRREGVIIKFDENQLWKDRLNNNFEEYSDVHENIMYNSDIIPFKEKKTINSEKLKEQFIQAQDLLNSFKNNNAKPSEIFDIEILAKYIAISEVLCAYHSFVWHNLRFYYNPITRKLEPVGFDGYTDNGKLKMYYELFFGEYRSNNEAVSIGTHAPYLNIYQDEEFNRYYIKALLEYSSFEYIDRLVKEFQNEAVFLENKIRDFGYPDYKFDIKAIYDRARKINNTIKPLDEHSLKIYRSKKQQDLAVASNHHSLPLDIIGSANKNELLELDIEPIMIKSNKRKSAPSFTTISIPSDHRFVFYKLPNTEKIYSTKIKNWRPPLASISPKYSSNGQLKIPLDESKYEVRNNHVTIHSGDHKITSPIIIPSDYTISFQAGTTIDLQNKSYILSYGKLDAIGNEDAPILITSSDNSSQGVNIIQSKTTCTLKHTTFKNLNTLLENEWQLTGALTFYESDVNLSHVTVTNNHCEDALNIIRSDFEIEYLNINNTFADGFDCDFCNGTVDNSLFFDTGNDGLDFSGSRINVYNTTLENIGDKGISAGEEATVIVENTSVKNAVIGIASKDLSKVNINKVNLINCNKGFAAYRKKPEFGGAKINVSSYSETNVEHLINKDDESEINLLK